VARKMWQENQDVCCIRNKKKSLIHKMETLLPITPDVLKSLLASDDLTTDFINNSAYTSNTNIINVAKVLLSYYMSMNKVKDMLSQYNDVLKKGNLSPEKKSDIELRVQLLTYVVSQKNILDYIDKEKKTVSENIKLFGKKKGSKKMRSKRMRSKRMRSKKKGLKRY
jgi:hypothetical protein